MECKLALTLYTYILPSSVRFLNTSSWIEIKLFPERYLEKNNDNTKDN